jgi:MFS family permease
MPMTSSKSLPAEAVAIAPAAEASAAPALAAGGSLFLRVFPSVMLPMFLAALDQTIVATALPAIAGGLGDVERISWVVIAYLVANTIAAPVYGRLGDAIGRKRMMLGALAVFMAASLLCALSTSVLMLTAARLLQGAGGGGLMTLSQALIAEAVPPRQRGQYQGYLSGMYATAAMFGPVAGGFLTLHFGWPSVFLINLPLGLVAMLLVRRLPSHAVRGGKLQFDVWGTVLFAACITSVLLALERGQRFDPAALPGIAALLVVALLALVLLLRQERRAPAAAGADVPQARHLAHRPDGRLRRRADRLHGDVPADVPADCARR